MFDDDKDVAKAGSSRLSVKKKGLSRRALLKAGAAVAGAAVGSDAFRGFPTIWAQEIKDIELRHVGVSYSVVKAIGDQAVEGPRLQGHDAEPRYLGRDQPLHHPARTPSISPISKGWQAKLAAKRGVIQGIEVKKIKEFDNILPIFTKGEIDGHKISAPGHLALRGDVHRQARLRPSCTTASPNGRPSCRRSTTPIRSATGPTSSTMPSPSGRT